MIVVVVKSEPPQVMESSSKTPTYVMIWASYVGEAVLLGACGLAGVADPVVPALLRTKGQRHKLVMPIVCKRL